jgi:hypothetical protein
VVAPANKAESGRGVNRGQRNAASRRLEPRANAML